MRQPFFQCITDFIFLEDSPQKADIIFIPGGNYPDTARKAAKLYREGFAPLILPSGRFSVLKGRFDGAAGYETEWEYLSHILVEEGVPREAILREDKATYTYENAILSRKRTDSLGLRIRKALLCCQAFHARRSFMYYQEQFPETEFAVCPVVTRGIGRNTWYKTEKGLDTVLGEMERCGGQFHQIMREYMEFPE